MGVSLCQSCQLLRFLAPASFATKEFLKLALSPVSNFPHKFGLSRKDFWVKEAEVLNKSPYEQSCRSPFFTADTSFQNCAAPNDHAFA